MTEKRFDSVQMVEEAQAELDALLKSMTPEEELEFWRKETEKLRERQREIRSRQEEQRKAS